jgi:hypothetical protein
VTGELALSCPELPPPETGEYGEVLGLLGEYALRYYECRDEKDAIVEILNGKKDR